MTKLGLGTMILWNRFFAVDNSVIPRAILPTVPVYFFLSDTGSGVSRFARNTLTITGVSVFIRLIRVESEGDEVIGPKWLVPCSPSVMIVTMSLITI